MLDVANIIRPSNDGRFDTVAFFDRNQEFVYETQKRIPGANGFPGDFTSVVLLHYPDEETIIDGEDPLSSPTDSLDEALTRKQQLLLAQRHSFIRLFPFDVINLDLEEFLFKPRDPMPGRVINALRKIFAWQRRQFTTQQSAAIQQVDAFTLMFTTQIGPPNISEDYLNELRNCLDRNLRSDESLIGALTDRTEIDNIIALQERDFDNFFKLSTPKMLAATLMSEDWHVVSSNRNFNI